MNFPNIRTRYALVMLFVALLLTPVENALGQWAVPDELRAAVSVLNEEQTKFIASGDVLEFIPERQLEHELATRDADSLRSFVDDVMSLATIVLHGANDTNVPVVEAEQVVESLKAREIPVKYVLVPDEGHGWRKTANRVTSDVEIVRWFETHL